MLISVWEVRAGSLEEVPFELQSRVRIERRALGARIGRGESYL